MVLILIDSDISTSAYFGVVIGGTELALWKLRALSGTWGASTRDRLAVRSLDQPSDARESWAPQAEIVPIYSKEQVA